VFFKRVLEKLPEFFDIFAAQALFALKAPPAKLLRFRLFRKRVIRSMSACPFSLQLNHSNDVAQWNCLLPGITG
jgi:hypothetical protein